MSRLFDQELATHCSPALAGIKPANLMYCRLDHYPIFEQMLERYNEAFSRKGIRFEPLCRCRESCLLLVYRFPLLARQLAKPEVRALLRQAGYPDDNTVTEDLTVLAGRLWKSEGEFPHEIGVFLGYPTEDVVGFVRHGGQNFKLCGHWKVYSDEQSAQRLFARYDRCRSAVCEHLSKGITISQLFGAA